MTTATKERTKKKAAGTVLATDTLRRALSEVAAAVPSRHAKPILQSVLLYNGGLTGTDLELEVSAELPWTGDKLLLPFARLKSIVAECRADEVSITVDGAAMCRVGWSRHMAAAGGRPRRVPRLVGERAPPALPDAG